MDGRSPQIHVLSSRVGDLIEGKTEKKNKTGGVAGAQGWNSCGLAAEKIWEYWVSWRRVSPPLLIGSALEAVRKWRYEPTYLNGQPVPVQRNVKVTFRLKE